MITQLTSANRESGVPLTSRQLTELLRSIIESPIPLPGQGQTGSRHLYLMDVGRQDLALARLAEAHWDAVSILAEAGRQPVPGAIYGVWASEIPGQSVELRKEHGGFTIHGTKKFCSGAGIVDRALVTVQGPESLLLDIDVRDHHERMQVDSSSWKTAAFSATGTATVEFLGAVVGNIRSLGGPGWYIGRPGFWHGACGPAACWAGGAQALVDYAINQHRSDPHTFAHIGAMSAQAWGLRACLMAAGDEIDGLAKTAQGDRVLALSVRHIVEQACTDILRRLTRAFGPHPLAMDALVARRCQELDLYLRQSHAERDLEWLGRDMRALAGLHAPNSQ
jgi:alkylation response protein AidB-like acyl-CoA dehydrogenase